MPYDEQGHLERCQISLIDVLDNKGFEKLGFRGKKYGRHVFLTNGWIDFSIGRDFLMQIEGWSHFSWKLAHIICKFPTRSRSFQQENHDLGSD